MIKLSSLEIEAQTLERLQAKRGNILSLYEGGNSVPEIIEALKLKASPEELQAYIDEYNVLSLLCNSFDTIEAIADMLGIDTDRAKRIASSFEEIAQKLKAQKKSYAQIASETLMAEKDIKEYFKNLKNRKDMRLFLSYYWGGRNEYSLADEIDLDVETIKAFIRIINKRVLTYSTNGKSLNEIAILLGTKAEMIAGIVTDNEEDYTNLMAINRQEKINTLKAGQNDRLKRLSALREHLMNEINSRGLQDISTDKLISLYLKTEEAIKSEVKAALPVITTSKMLSTSQVTLSE